MRRDEHAVIVRRDDGGYEAVLWNLCGEKKEDVELFLSFPVETDSAALVDLVDEETCNPLACWHRMGEPADLTAEQAAFLRAAGQPAREVKEAVQNEKGAGVTLTLAPNALVRMRVVPVKKVSDRGYDYNWYCEN